MAFTAAEIAARIGARVEGAGAQPLAGTAGLEEAGPEELSFYSNPKYRKAFAATRAGAVILAPADAQAPEASAAERTLLVVDNPYAAFARASALFHPPQEPVAGVDSGAFVASTARVAESAQVMAFAWVGAGAIVGPRTILHPFSFVGDFAMVGADCLFYPGAVLRERCVAGDRVILGPNAVVGSDGFGFAFDPAAPGGPEHVKIPQAGIARLENDVELGACACVDRATTGETVIEHGAKIDNLVQIAHNVRVGALTVMAAQVGIAGSTRIGMGVQIGGQAGIPGHLAVGDLARIAAQSGVISDLDPGAAVAGMPALPHREFFRIVAAWKQVPDLLKAFRKLEERVKALESGER